MVLLSVVGKSTIPCSAKSHPLMGFISLLVQEIAEDIWRDYAKEIVKKYLQNA